MKLIFQTAHNKSHPNRQYLLILYFKSYGNICVAWPLSGMGSFQILLYQVTRDKNLSFLYSKSYSPLNFRKIDQIMWFCYTPDENYKETIWGRAECPAAPPPPPPHAPCGKGLNVVLPWFVLPSPQARNTVSITLRNNNNIRIRQSGIF